MDITEEMMNGTPSGSETHAQAEQRNSQESKISMLDALRAFGVMAGPSLLFDHFLLGSVAAIANGTLTHPRTRTAKRLRPLVALGTALAVVYPTLFRRWMLRWGATDEERHKVLTGDELVPNPLTVSTRAITVNAPITAVWPWLAQIGQDRGGFYSYEWLENLAGCKMHNADRIHPEWQQREIGEEVKLHWAQGNKVVSFEPNRVLVLKGWGAFVVESLDDQHTRVILRTRIKGGWSTVYHVLLIELPHFLMERKMLLGIKKRAETAWHTQNLVHI